MMIKKQIFLSLLTLIASLSTHAQLAIDGNTISWPDDGWYQVQDAVNYQQICNGGRSCTVEPGRYIVINHSTGQRFTDVVVERLQPSQPDGVTITGYTISWPDNGWYQVQDMADFSEVCSGTRSCTVQPGTYSVINHTTGKRFDGIEVKDDRESVDSPIAVMGNVISWPDDGWYQVQESQTHHEICSGTRSCTVQNGVYTIINHTTGLRVENVEVNLQEIDTDPLPLLDTAWNLIQYTNVRGEIANVASDTAYQLLFRSQSNAMDVFIGCVNYTHSTYESHDGYLQLALGSRDGVVCLNETAEYSLQHNAIMSLLTKESDGQSVELTYITTAIGLKLVATDGRTLIFEKVDAVAQQGSRVEDPLGVALNELHQSLVSNMQLIHLSRDVDEWRSCAGGFGIGTAGNRCTFMPELAPKTTPVTLIDFEFRHQSYWWQNEIVSFQNGGAREYCCRPTGREVPSHIESGFGYSNLDETYSFSADTIVAEMNTINLNYRFPAWFWGSERLVTGRLSLYSTQNRDLKCFIERIYYDPVINYLINALDGNTAENCTAFIRKATLGLNQHAAAITAANDNQL